MHILRTRWNSIHQSKENPGRAQICDTNTHGKNSEHFSTFGVDDKVEEFVGLPVG